MRWILALAALLLLAAATPAIGNFHEAVAAKVPDRVFVLAMSGTSFNGLHAPDTPLLEAYLGDRVRFAILATEPHTFHLHGHPWRLDEGGIVDTFYVDADRPHIFDVLAGGPDHHEGDWLYHCHFNAHVAGGMWGVFRVYPYAAEMSGTTITLTDAHGAPVDGASLDATLDGAPLAFHAEPLGGGRYAMHAALPATGQLVVTATHPELGVTVLRASLDGSAPATPDVAGLEHLHAHS